MCFDILSADHLKLITEIFVDLRVSVINLIQAINLYYFHQNKFEKY